MNSICRAAGIFILAGQCHAAVDPGPKSLPIVGTWEWQLPDGCVENHTFLPNGTLSGTSGAEYTEENYTISSTPNEYGFYRLNGFTLKDTGGPDCADSSEVHTGKPWTVYILFSPRGDLHLACSEPDMKSCWGPYRRVHKSVP